MLPNQAMGYHPYDATHVITQLQILMFAALAFVLQNLKGKYPAEVPSVNLDVDWLYRRIGRGFIGFTKIFWNGLNQQVHALFMGELVRRVNEFTKSGQVQVLEFISDPLHSLGLLGKDSRTKVKFRLSKRARLGVHPVGLTAFFSTLFLLGFLLMMLS